MKKNMPFVTVLILTFLFTSINLFGQTTQEEYNYVTKGYKVQIESGLDMKKGYTLKDLGNWGYKSDTENRKCEFKELIKQGQTKPSAIMMIYNRTGVDSDTKYICIPSPDASEEIWKQTLNYLNAGFDDNFVMLQATIWGLMKFSSQEAAK